MRTFIIAVLFVSTVVALRSAPRLKLIPYANLRSLEIDESSGLAKSPSHSNTYWTHNDSGDSARLFAIDREGNSDRLEGIQIPGAANVDWEDIAFDANGQLYVGDFGNNDNRRRDLALYRISEPNPLSKRYTGSTTRIPFAFPDQKTFPAAKYNFDCEAIYFLGQTPYVLSKHRADTRTTLYRFDTLDTKTVNTLTRVSDFDIGGRVTAADVSPDESRLAVLTYTAVWIFEKPTHTDNFLENPSRRIGIKANQCEAICWDDNETLLISNEQASLFEITLTAIPRL